jgi:KDO2-lipid IV(A) lauroyltransferase
MLDFQFYKFGEFLTCALPLKAAYRVGKFLSNLQFILSRKDREAVISNLRVILPKENEKRIRDIAREVFTNFGLYLVEFLRFKDIDLNFVKNHFSIQGKEYVDNALKEGKGVIMLTAHMGNWEVGGMALSLLGYKLIVIALDHKDPRINKFFRQRRESKGMEVSSLGASVKHCFNGLRNNKLVAILGDRDFSNSGYLMNFLGKTKRIPRGPAVLAIRTGASIVPCFVVREGLSNLTLECFPPIKVNKETTEEEVIQGYIKIIEGQIYKYPSQWLMFREFWKE